MTIDLDKAGEILARAKAAAIDYYQLTGKPLGITGEIGEYLAARLLGLKLADARSPGYDALDHTGRRIQIKARCIPASKRLTGQRLGSIHFDHKWEIVLLILLDEYFEPRVIYEADRAAVEAALTKPGSRSRNERGALAVSKFKAIGRKVWQQTRCDEKSSYKAPTYIFGHPAIQTNIQISKARSPLARARLPCGASKVSPTFSSPSACSYGWVIPLPRTSQADLTSSVAVERLS